MHIWKKIGKWFLIFVGVILSLFLLLIILVFAFEDKIKAYAVERINQNLNTEIKVSSIDLSIWSNFPYASLDFKDVLIMDPTTVNKDKDTMLYAKTLSMQFSIWDMVSGDYRVKEVKLNYALLNLYIDKQGNENYHFWKDTEEKGDGKFKFDLEKLVLLQTRINYQNKFNGSDYSFKTSSTTLSGKFNEKEFDLNANSNLFVNHFRSGKINLLKKKNSQLKLSIHVNLPKEELKIKTGNLKIEDLLLGVTGAIGIGDTARVDLAIQSNEVELESIYKIFPRKFSQHLLNYSSQGAVKVNAIVQGEITTTKSPIINADFSVSKGKMTEKESKVTLTDLNFKGHYTNKNNNDADELIIPELSGNFLDGSFKASLDIKNFTDPKIKLAVAGDFNLKTLHQFLRPAKIESMTGDLHTSIQLLAGIDSENKSMDIISAKGKAKIKNTAITSKSLALDLTQLKGEIEIKNNDASIEGFSGKKGNSDFEINGVIKNFMPYALKSNQHINIVASLVSDKIYVEDFVGMNAEEPKSGKPADYTFPEKINFNLDATIRNLSFGEFHAKNVSGNFKLIDKKFTAKKLNLNMAEGKCYGDLTIDGSGEKGFLIETKQSLKEINVSKLFQIFENFGQKEITNENIGGKLNSEIEFFAYMDNQLNLKSDKIISTIQLELIDGELKNLILLNDVVGYIRQEKIMSVFIGKKNLERLDKQVKNIRFSTLTNTIAIKNEEIIIPEMKVVSSTVDFNLFGKHNFKNDIDYHINFRFKELKMDEENPNYDASKDDGKGLRVYLQITGNLDNPIYKFDKKELKTDLKEKLKEEKNNLKSVLKTELGLYKKDSTIKLKETPKEEVKFLFEWDEGKSSEENIDTEEKKEKERKRVKKQKEKTSVNSPKQEVKFTFEEE